MTGSTRRRRRSGRIDYHGYTIGSLENWGRQPNNIRLFAKQQTGWFKRSSSFFRDLSPRRNLGSVGNADQIDLFFAKATPVQRKIMLQHFVIGQKLPESMCTQKMHAMALGRSEAWYSKHFNILVDEVRDFLLSAADK